MGQTGGSNMVLNDFNGAKIASLSVVLLLWLVLVVGGIMQLSL